MDQPNYKKRRVSSGSVSMSCHGGSRQKRASTPYSYTPEEEPQTDSGFDTFIFDESADELLASPIKDEASFLWDEEDLSQSDLDDDSPIVINLDKMSVNSNRKPVDFAVSPYRDGMTRSRSKKEEKFVSGQSLLKFAEESKNYELLDGDRSENREFGLRPFRSQVTVVPGFFDKETCPAYQRDSDLFEHHPLLQPQMRGMLFEWIMEVCKAHFLQRKTYNLAVDYVDRFLTYTHNLPKTVFQLLGVAALSIASKIEEIFPPTITEMAYVTDGGHGVDEIKAMEKLIFSVLKTALIPVTVSEWVAEYLHQTGQRGFREAIARGRHIGPSHKASHPFPQLAVDNQLPLQLYCRICRIMDLAMLDAESLQFSYRQIAASAISFVEGGKITRILIERGFDLASIETCSRWMIPFAEFSERTFGAVDIACPDDRHRIQWPHLQSFDCDMNNLEEILECKRKAKNIPDASKENENLPQVICVQPEKVSPQGLSSAISNASKGCDHASSSIFLTPPNSQEAKSCPLC